MNLYLTVCDSVSLEVLTVLGAGPIAAYIVYLLAADDPARHYWIIVISTAELYGGYGHFLRVCPVFTKADTPPSDG